MCRILHLLLLVFALATAPSLRAADEIVADFTAGFAGNIPSGNGLVPVTVTLRNTTRSTQGVIEVFQHADAMQAEVKHLLPFTSPANSAKRFTLLVRKSGDDPLRVRVRFDAHFRSLRHDFPASAQNKPFVLCVGMPAQQTQQLSRGISAAYTLLSVKEEDLPDEPLGLDMVHAVMLTSATVTEMSDANLVVLGQWLQTGGRIILLDPLFDDLLEAKLQLLHLPDHVDLSRTGVYHAGAGYFGSGGFGAAPVAFWAPQQKPVPNLARALFPAALKASGDGSRMGSYRGIFQSLTKEQGSYGLGGFLWLALIILAYVLVIGPLDYFICKKSGKPYLTWPIFLLAIAVFSCVAYWYSTIVHSGSMEAVYVNIVDATPHQATARGNSLFWLYSTKNDVYTLAAPHPATNFSSRETTLTTGVANVDVLHGQGTKMQAKIPIFSSKLFDASWYYELPAAITVEELGESELKLTLPEPYAAAHIILATMQGVQYADFDQASGTWRLKERVSWYKQLQGALSEFESYRGFRPGISGIEELPTEEQLRTYTMWISFGHVARQDGQTEADADADADDEAGPVTFSPSPFIGYHNTFDSLLMRADDRERALNIYDRLLDDGRVLVIYLQEEAPVFPLKFTIFDVESRTANMIRLQLPPRP